MSGPAGPSRSWERVLGAILPGEVRQQVLDDLSELYTGRLRTAGPAAAERWYRRQVIGTARERLLRFASWPMHWRDSSPGALLDGVRREFGYGLRSLASTPGFSLTVIATLALGLGSTTAIVSVVDGVLLRPLPYANEAELVRVWESKPEAGLLEDWPSPANFLDWVEHNDAFDGLAAWWPDTAVYRQDGRSVQVAVAHVSGDFFRLLAASPLLGNTFGVEQAEGSYYDNSGNHYGPRRPLVVGEGFWRQAMGGDPAAIGRVLEINRQDWTVVGVLPAAFGLPSEGVDLWTPWDLTARPLAEGHPISRDSRFLGVVGRVLPGLTIEGAQERMNVLAAALSQQHPETNAGWGVRLTPLRAHVLGASRGPLLVLLGSVLLVLVIACANIAGLMLARAVERSDELGIRRALGASRALVARQVLVECFLLALAGAALGLAMAQVGVEALVRLQPGDLPRVESITVDARVALLSLLLTAASVPLFGLLPAWFASRSEPGTAMRSAGARASQGIRPVRARSGLLVAQVAVAVLLLAAAGQLSRSFLRLIGTSPGFDANGVLVVAVPLESRVASTAAGRVSFFAQLLGAVRELPGVEAAGAVTALPMGSVGADFDRPYWRQGEPDPGADAAEAMIRMATPGYFAAVGRPLLAGRDFTLDDRLDYDDPRRDQQERVILVSETLARRVWPGADPIGNALVMSYPLTLHTYRVVGVVGDVRHHDLREEPQEEIFIPYYQNPYPALNVVMRTAGDPMALASAVEALVAELNPDQPLHSVVPMSRLVAASVARERFAAVLTSAFAVAALIVTGVGLYGAIAYSVGCRTRELGIRMALGARDSQLRLLVLSQGLRIALAGATIGLLAAVPMGSLLGGLLYGISSGDGVALAAAFGLACGIAILAAWLPARRAARLSAGGALRAS